MGRASVKAPAIPHSLRTWLMLLPALPVLLWAVVVTLTLVQGEEVEKTFERYALEDMRRYREIYQLYNQLTVGQVRVHTLLEQASHARIYSAEQVFISLSEQIDLVDQTRVLFRSGSGTSWINPEVQYPGLHTALQLYRDNLVQNLRLSSANLDRAYHQMSETSSSFLELNKLFLELLDQVEQKSTRDFAQLQKSTWEKNSTIATVATLTALLVLFGCMSLYRRLSKGFQQLLHMATAMQGGALDKNNYQFAEDEMGFLAKRFFFMGVALNDMRNSLESRVKSRTKELEEVTYHLAAEVEKSQAMADQLRYQAETDALTGLYNRRYFMEAFEREWSRDQRHSTPLSLLVIDIDWFKQVNDQYGHQVGDQCLHKVAQALKSCVRRRSDLIARFGGEEFAVMLPGMQQAEASIIANEMLQQVRLLDLPPVTEQRKLTVSIGVGELHKGIKTSEAMFREVDQALYRAKQGGRDCYCLVGQSPNSQELPDLY